MHLDSLGSETLAAESTDAGPSAVRTLAATIAFHPDLARIGEHLELGVNSNTVEVSRTQGLFESAGGDKRALDDPYVSRQPVRFAVDWRRGLTVASASDNGLRIGDAPVREPVTFSIAQLERGVVLTLSKRVILLVHLIGDRRAEHRSDHRDHGLVGCSRALASLRSSIDKVADLAVPVLLRGETGTGKDMVARAIHAASSRASAPYVAVNMGAISPTTAVSELFGHARGAFTGASGEHIGLFERADGGTILLDEIGETPDAVQPMLLRVLETGEVLPVGASETRKTSVRVIAATDADLERAQKAGTFRTALLHRLSGFEIDVAPLRERPEDIPLLVRHFLRLELESLGEQSRLEQSPRDKHLWFGPKLMRRLLAFNWPGNVRQLLNAVRQLVIASRGLEVLTLDAKLESLLGAPRPGGDGENGEPLRPAELTHEVVKRALRQNGWAMGPTATALNVPRSSLYDFIDKTPGLRTARDIDVATLESSFESCGGDLDAMSEMLEVSKRGIRLRLREAGLLDRAGNGEAR